MAKKKITEKTQPSSICRVNKESNYTVMSNFHLRSKTLSLKAVGLLSKILSLTDEWDYSIAGLTSICKEGETAIKTALAELKDRGYLVVSKLMPNETKSGRIEYVYDFFEYSAKDDPKSPLYDDGSGIKSDSDSKGVSTANVENSKKTKIQEVEKQGIEILPLEILPVEIQAIENQGQLNNNNKILNNQILMNQTSINQSSAETAVKPVETVETPERKKIDGLMDDYLTQQEVYTKVVRENIDYDGYVCWIRSCGTRSSTSVQELDEIVAIIVRAICSRKKTDVICGQEFPHEIVKSTLLKADRECIENALDTMKQTDDIRNIERYFISTLFNEVNNHNFRSNNESRWAEYAVKRDLGYY